MSCNEQCFADAYNNVLPIYTDILSDNFSIKGVVNKKGWGNKKIVTNFPKITLTIGVQGETQNQLFVDWLYNQDSFYITIPIYGIIKTILVSQVGITKSEAVSSSYWKHTLELQTKENIEADIASVEALCS